MALKTDYKDAMFDGQRRYRLISNEDGTYSLPDETKYTQPGDKFGANDINATNTEINKLAVDSKNQLNAHKTGGDHDGRYYTESEVDSKLSGKANSSHTHDDRYYTEGETNNLLNGKAAASHSHTYSEITGKPGAFPPSSHNHDDRYYTEGEMNNLLNGKANSSHTHDDRYYTEGEMNNLLNGKANSSHTHAYNTITGRPTGLDSGYVRSGQKAGTSVGLKSTIEGNDNTASGTYSHAEGSNNTASGTYSHVEGSDNIVKGNYAHAEGYKNTASSINAHTEGSNNTASGMNSHAGGSYNTASGANSYVCGTYNKANQYQFVIGTYNVEKAAPNTSSDRFIIGGGWSTSGNKNCFRVHSNGSVYSAGAYNTSGADYAEYFEWLEGNSRKKDLVGYFVTLDGEKIKLASPGDYILGIVSSTPSVIGNSYDDQWSGMEVHDDWGRPIWEEYEEPEQYIEHEFEDGTVERELIVPKETGRRIKINPDYDPKKPYAPRSERPEWDVVGMLGVLRVRDDGTCQVNRYCNVSTGGIATASESGYRVVGRVSDNIIKILFR